MNKTHWKKTFNKDYLGSHDLDEGRDLQLIINNVVVKPVKDQSGSSNNCNVAIFKGKVKPMILNVTACKQLKRFTGSNFIEDWKDIAIQLYVSEVKAFGEVVDALRIRDQQPTMTKEELNPESTKWPKALETVKNKGEKGITTILKHYTISEKNIEVLKNEISVS